MITYDLRGKAALVTGAASGVGFATAQLLVKSGAKVALNFLPGDERGAEAVRLLQTDGDVIAAPGDVADASSAEKMITDAVGSLGRLDLLVNNAGAPGVQDVIPASRLDLMTEDLWSFLLQVNLMSVFRCSKAAAPALRTAGGAIVNVASVSGNDATGSTIGYCAAKAGVINLTKNLARALAPEVRVNAVAPGIIDSSWGVRWTEEKKQASLQKALLKKFAAASDIADVIVYLGFGATIVTGATLTTDGGLTLG
ncbi:SDR family NAD(P)-dependent oxidoreductase [Leptospira interrogans]